MLTITILTHIYYETSYEILRHYFLQLENQNTIFLFNISDCINRTIDSEIKNDFPNAYIIKTSNIGKDIGAKLALIDLSIQLKLNPDYFIFLHDKHSPHSALGSIWRNKLFRIVEPQNIEAIIHLYEKNKNIGIVAAKEFIMNEYNEKTDSFNCTSNLLLKKLISHYALNLQTYDFIGGTMFWVKGNSITSFFKKHNSLAIRATLEHGNVLDNDNGTLTHSWERLLSWIVLEQGYTIKGI